MFARHLGSTRIAGNERAGAAGSRGSRGSKGRRAEEVVTVIENHEKAVCRRSEKERKKIY